MRERERERERDRDRDRDRDRSREMGLPCSLFMSGAMRGRDGGEGGEGGREDQCGDKRRGLGDGKAKDCSFIHLLTHEFNY